MHGPDVSLISQTQFGKEIALQSRFVDLMAPSYSGMFVLFCDHGGL